MSLRANLVGYLRCSAYAPVELSCSYQGFTRCIIFAYEGECTENVGVGIISRLYAGLNVKAIGRYYACKIPIDQCKEGWCLAALVDSLFQC